MTQDEFQNEVLTALAQMGLSMEGIEASLERIEASLDANFRSLEAYAKIYADELSRRQLEEE